MLYAVLTRQNGLQCRIGYTMEQDPVTNTTRISLKSVEMSAGTTMGAYWVTGSVSIGGKKVWGYSSWYAQVMLSTGWNAAGHCPEGAPDVIVQHDAAGEASVKFSAKLDFGNGSGGYSYSGSKTETLPQIPRASILEAEPGELGQPMTIRIHRWLDSNREDIHWSCGSLSGIIAEKTNEETLTWVPGPELASQETASDRVTVTLTAVTWLGETEQGMAQLQVECQIPQSVVPGVRLTVEDSMGYASAYGGFVQLRSRARVRVHITPAYGAWTAQTTIRLGGLTAPGETAVFELTGSGNQEITAEVTDSRGRTAKAVTQISVIPYARPWASIRNTDRCDENGSPLPDGAYARIGFTAGVTGLGGKNTAVYTLQWRVHPDGSWHTVNLPEYRGQYSLVSAAGRFPAGIQGSYDCRIGVQDAFETVYTPEERLGAAFALLDFNRSILSVGVGQRAVEPNTVHIGMPLKMAGHRITDVADPETGLDAVNKQYVDTLLRRFAQQLGIEVQGL